MELQEFASELVKAGLIEDEGRTATVKRVEKLWDAIPKLESAQAKIKELEEENKQLAFQRSQGRIMADTLARKAGNAEDESAMLRERVAELAKELGSARRRMKELEESPPVNPYQLPDPGATLAREAREKHQEHRIASWDEKLDALWLLVNELADAVLCPLPHSPMYRVKLNKLRADAEALWSTKQ